MYIYRGVLCTVETLQLRDMGPFDNQPSIKKLKAVSVDLERPSGVRYLGWRYPFELRTPLLYSTLNHRVLFVYGFFLVCVDYSFLTAMKDK